MKIQTLGWLVGVTALISSASVLACSQAEVVCQAGHAGSGLAFAAKYYPVGAPVACTIPGDQVGLETYHPKGGGDDGTQPDFSVPSLVAVQTDAMGNMIIAKKKVGSVDPDGTNIENMDGSHVLAKHPAYALGSFATVSPDADGFCVMAAPKPAVHEFGKVDAVPPDPMADPPDPGSDEVPPEAVTYEWSNVKVYVTASAQGTQFSGHLKVTDKSTDTCSAEYNVAAVWPSASCGKKVKDGVDMDGKPKFKTVPDQSACCPNPDPVGGRAAGSGINPDFPVKCDPDLLLCVLDTPDPSKLPVLNPTWALDADGVATGICKLTTAAAAP